MDETENCVVKRMHSLQEYCGTDNICVYIVANVIGIGASVIWCQPHPARCYGISTTVLCLCLTSTLFVRCINIKRTTPVLFPESRTCPFITKSKVSLNVILAFLLDISSK